MMYSCALCMVTTEDWTYSSGDPPSYRRFYYQLGEFSVAVVVGRIICGSLVSMQFHILVLEPKPYALL